MKGIPNPNANSKEYKAELMAHLEKLKANKEAAQAPLVVSPRATGKKVIKKDIQADVDEFISLDAQYKALEKKLKALRGNIEPYMKKYDISVIEGTETGRVEINPTNRAIVNARFTSYDTEGVMASLEPEIAKKCIVEVVDKDKLDLLVKLGEVPKEIEAFKMVLHSSTFGAKHV